MKTWQKRIKSLIMGKASANPRSELLRHEILAFFMNEIVGKQKMDNHECHTDAESNLDPNRPKRVDGLIVISRESFEFIIKIWFMIFFQFKIECKRVVQLNLSTKLAAPILLYLQDH